ncbi:hypothetical protein C1H46_004968 [Malus baccata]|uniref:Uncharacterized protein n=1 Tax=Malus baccata TaxID=106549 RepID=A0A540NEK1_MALBA|nr:hypothetical protein C1H46_004968 [Malus baccata]
MIAYLALNFQVVLDFVNNAELSLAKLDSSFGLIYSRHAKQKEERFKQQNKHDFVGTAYLVKQLFHIVNCLCVFITLFFIVAAS